MIPYPLQLQRLIAADPLRLQVLRHVRTLALPDCRIGAGFVRNAVWDHLHGLAGAPFDTDIDVIWYDPLHATPARDAALERELSTGDRRARWSVKN